MLMVSTRWRGLGNEEEAAASEAVEKNKALVRRFLEADAKSDLDTLEGLLAPDFVLRSALPGQEPDREGYLRSAAGYHAAFSDIRYVIEKQGAEGDEVVTSLTKRSIHDRAEWLAFVPTGKEDQALITLIQRIVGGKIAEEWSELGNVLKLTQKRLRQEMRERERVTREFQVARSIQQASLPKEAPALEGWQFTPYTSLLGR
jgi:predicted ester cyclase